MDAMSTMDQPALTAVTDAVGIVAQDRPVVSQSNGLQSALRATLEAERGFLLLTPSASRITSILKTTLERGFSAWVVREPEGQGWYDGLAGWALRWDGTSYVPIVDDDQPRMSSTYAGGERPVGSQLVVQLRLRHPAAATTALGTPCTLLGVRFTGAKPAGWGISEPVTEPWRQKDLTAFARERAPEPTTMTFVGGGTRPMQGLIDVSRGATGVDESVTVHIGYDQGEEPPVGLLDGVLAQLASTATLVTMSAVVMPGRADLTHEPRFTGVATPVAFAAGPEAVGAVGAERALAAGDGINAIGMGAAGVLYRFGSDPADAWRQLDHVMRHLGVPELQGVAR